MQYFFCAYLLCAKGCFNRNMLQEVVVCFLMISVSRMVTLKKVLEGFSVNKNKKRK